MTVYRVMTPDEAAKVRGPTKTQSAKGKPDLHALDPIPLKGDTEFILPVEVLNDPHHAAALEAYKIDPGKLVDLKDPTKQREVTPDEFKPPPQVGKTLEELIAEKAGQSFYQFNKDGTVSLYDREHKLAVTFDPKEPGPDQAAYQLWLLRGGRTLPAE